VPRALAGTTRGAVIRDETFDIGIRETRVTEGRLVAREVSKVLTIDSMKTAYACSASRRRLSNTYISASTTLMDSLWTLLNGRIARFEPAAARNHDRVFWASASAALRIIVGGPYGREHQRLTQLIVILGARPSNRKDACRSPARAVSRSACCVAGAASAADRGSSLAMAASTPVPRS
jgi:hypothetical protein